MLNVHVEKYETTKFCSKLWQHRAVAWHVPVPGYAETPQGDTWVSIHPHTIQYIHWSLGRSRAIITNQFLIIPKLWCINLHLEEILTLWCSTNDSRVSRQSDSHTWSLLYFHSSGHWATHHHYQNTTVTCVITICCAKWREQARVHSVAGRATNLGCHVMSWFARPWNICTLAGHWMNLQLNAGSVFWQQEKNLKKCCRQRREIKIHQMNTTSTFYFVILTMTSV